MSSPLPPPPQPSKPAPKPIWKRWWFWAIVVIVLLIAAGLGSSETTDTEAEASSPSPATSATQPPVPSPVETGPVPDVVGKSVDDARAELEDAGFVVRVETMVTNLARKGTVMLTAPQPGSSVEVGDTVTLTVAEPLPKIPNVVGKTLANAKRALANAGFEVGMVTQQTSSKRKGTVISQSPSGGTPARPGRTVSLVTAKPAPQPTSNCTPGYSPCLPLGPSDYDCAGGSGNGPAYTEPGVTYRVTGSDPYDLDFDNNGSGCE